MAPSDLPQPGYHSRMNLEFSDEALVDLGRQALTVEIDGLRAQVPRLGPQFARACRICLDCRGRIVVTSCKCGTFDTVTGPSASKHPANMGRVAFLAPEIRISPSSGMPP